MKDSAQELLSVDADAHLQKLAAHKFPSPALLPVELVRCALKRRAAIISIQVHSGRIVISDNGDGIDNTEWQTLACVVDTCQNVAAREKAMARMQDYAHPGIGLLAVFFPGARSIGIENSGPSGKSTMHIANGQIELQNTCSWPQGTRITISRGRGPAAKEIMLLGELCAAVRAEILINGRPLKKKPLLTNTMASININLMENGNAALLAIPVSGDVCRIWLLDQAIPWQVTAMAPVQGLIFNAALEIASPPTAPMIDIMVAGARQLNQWLAENYSQFPEQYQSRIEDLFFKQARSGGDPGWLSICAPFRLWNSQRRMTLAEVRQKAEDGMLFVIDKDKQPSHFSGPERDLLLLTPPQKDFLINHLRLPLVILNAHLNTKIRSRKISAFCRSKFSNIQRLVTPSKAHILESHFLSREENDLCREIEMRWRRKLEQTGPEAVSFKISVALVKGRGLVPAYWLKNEQGYTLRIRRGHPLTLLALQSISKDRDNSELAFAALMPDNSLTDARQ